MKINHKASSTLTILSITLLATTFCAEESHAQTTIFGQRGYNSVTVVSRPFCVGKVIQGDVGHAAIVFRTSSGHVYTRAMWPGGIRFDDPDDLAMARGEGCGLAARTAYVSDQRLSWVTDQVSSVENTNCRNYFPVGKSSRNADNCSCVTYTTRVWKEVTNQQEVWKLQLTPEGLANTIRRANGNKNRGRFNGGKVWK